MVVVVVVYSLKVKSYESKRSALILRYSHNLIIQFLLIT